MFDAIVIGAGASGSHAADHLARLGRSVLVLEKKSEAGIEVCCTGIVGRECFELLRVEPGIMHRTANAARFYAPSGRSMRLVRAEPVAYILDRGQLDRALMTRARAAGAEYRFSTQATAIEHRDGFVRLTAFHHQKQVTLEARTLILAAGYDSVLASSLGMGRIGDFLIGAQAEVELGGLEEVEVYADQRLIPGGFAWLVPTSGGRGLVGLVTRRQHERRLNELLDWLRAQGKIVSTDCCRSYGAIPIRPRARTYADRVLAVGDAAGQVKPTTGGGIYYGVLCAEIAAAVVDRGLETGRLAAGDLADYQRLWRIRLSKELNVGYLAHRLWRRLDNGDLEALFDLASKRGLPEIVATSGRFSFDWHGPLLMQLAGLTQAAPVRAEAEVL